MFAVIYLLGGAASVFFAWWLLRDKVSSASLKEAAPLVLAALIVFLALFFPYWTLNGVPGIVGELRADANGPLGDFVTGLASPLLQFVLLFYVVRAYYLQKTELKETKNALEEQARVSSNTQFQTFVFHVFEEHRKIKEEIELDGRYGDEAFDGLFDRVITNAIEKRRESYPERTFDVHDLTSFEIESQCEIVLNDEVSGIGRYFRFVYSFLRIASERIESLKKLNNARNDSRYQLEIDLIFEYLRFYRSMLSNNEKRVLLLNGMSTKGRRMVLYMKEFKILKNADVAQYYALDEYVRSLHQ